MASISSRHGTTLPPSPKAGDLFMHVGATEPWAFCGTDGLWTALGPIDFDPSIKLVTANYTTLPTDSFVIADATSGDILITLALGSTVFKPVSVKRNATDVSTNAIAVQGDGGTELIDGVVSWALPTHSSPPGNALGFVWKTDRWHLF